MSQEKKVRLYSYAIAAGVSLLLAAVYILLRDFGALDWKERFRVLSDAFTVPGLLLLCAGAMCWISSKGGLDGMAYILKYVGSLLIPGKRFEVKKYSDYVEEREGKRRSGYGFLLITGLVCLAITAVFLVLYYQTPA